MTEILACQTFSCADAGQEMDIENNPKRYRKEITWQKQL